MYECLPAETRGGVLDSLELRTVVSHHMGVGIPTQVFCKSNK